MPRFLPSHFLRRAYRFRPLAGSQQQTSARSCCRGLLVSSSGQTSFELNPADLRYVLQIPADVYLQPPEMRAAGGRRPLSFRKSSRTVRWEHGELCLQPEDTGSGASPLEYHGVGEIKAGGGLPRDRHPHGRKEPVNERLRAHPGVNLDPIAPKHCRGLQQGHCLFVGRKDNSRRTLWPEKPLQAVHPNRRATPDPSLDRPAVGRGGGEPLQMP
jgi:hypothetical protein